MHPSSLMRTSLSVTRAGAALKDFLSTTTVETVPGLGEIAMVPDTGKLTPVGTTPVADPKVSPAPAWPKSSTQARSMPQPLWQRASSVPPWRLVLPTPVTVPVNVPPTRYSRDDV